MIKTEPEVKEDKDFQKFLNEILAHRQIWFEKKWEEMSLHELNSIREALGILYKFNVDVERKKEAGFFILRLYADIWNKEPNNMEYRKGNIFAEIKNLTERMVKEYFPESARTAARDVSRWGPIVLEKWLADN